MRDIPRYRAHLGAVRELGHPVPPGGRVLDLGCRGDRAVRDLLEDQYDAFGCDFAFPDDPDVQQLVASDRLRHIEQHPYRLPFDDNWFDFVFSNQVFEHVQDYPETIAEIARVLKPGGASLHVFPSRYAPLEPHRKVPLGTMVRSYSWLWIWARLGIRNHRQRGQRAAAVARSNSTYLTTHTNYLPKRELRRLFGREFAQVRFCLREYFKHYPDRRYQRLYRFLQLAPVSFWLGEVLSTRVIFLAEPAKHP